MSLICCKDFMSLSYLSAKEMWKRPFWKGLAGEIMETQQPIMEFQWFHWAEKMSKKGQNPSHPNQVAHFLLKYALIILRVMVLKDLTINHLCRMLELRWFKKHLHWWHYLIATSLFYYINGHCFKFATSYKNMSPSMPT